MSIGNKVILVVFILLVLAGFARFYYYNVIIPEPYREELKLCLDDADGNSVERDACFRKYPHFN